MHSYQRMPNPGSESMGDHSRCLPMLLCFRNRKSSDKEALDRFVGKNVHHEQKPVDDDGPTEESSNACSKPEQKVVESTSKPKPKKSLFTIPKSFPKLKLPKGKKKTETTSTATSVSVSSAPKKIKSPPSTKTPPTPKNSDLPLPALQNDQSLDSSLRTAKSDLLTKVTSPDTPPPKEMGFLRGNSPTMEESSVASVDDYISKEYMPVKSIDTFMAKSKKQEQSSNEESPVQDDDDECSMISILTMDPTLQAISRREAELGPVAAKALYKPKKSKKNKKKRNSEPPGLTMPRNDSSMLEETMMRMTNPYSGGGSIVEGAHEDDGSSDDGSDALSEIAPLDLISL